MSLLKIGDCKIGDNNPCFIIAEVGSNHNNDFDTALKLIEEAAEAGANAVKFQTFRADMHYSRKTPTFKYLNSDTYELIKKLELPREWQKDLKEYCDRKKVIFLSSPCDIEAIDQLYELDVQAYKISSFDMVDLGLLEYMAKKGKPVIVSTGMADYEEITDVFKTMKKVNNEQLILLQCTSLYPAPPELSNLSSIKTMENMYGCVCGYSDHSMGIHIPIAAVALGAKVIEKHFTLDKNSEGPDHKFAIEPHELKELVMGIRDIEKAIGNGYKLGPSELEEEMFIKGRRSIIAASNIRKGEKITFDKVTVKRPGYGIKPKYINHIIGKTANCDIEADSWITWNMLD